MTKKFYSLKATKYSLRSHVTQRRLWENLRDIRDVSEEMYLINLQRDVLHISLLWDVSETLHETSQRRIHAGWHCWWGQRNKENKWYLAEAVTTQTCFARKEFWNIRETTGNHLWWSLFSGCKTATLVKEILMNKPFSVNDYKHLWIAASDLGKYLTTLIMIFDSVQNIWNFGL